MDPEGTEPTFLTWRIAAARLGVMALTSAMVVGCQPVAEPATTQSHAPVRPSMLLVAHRGAVHGHPENSLPALADAAEIGADGIEFDVQRSADGTWWLMHDSTVDRTTSGTGPLSELRDHEIERLQIDGGAGYMAHHVNAGLRVPRLQEALKTLDQYEGWLYIDLKEYADEAHASLATYALERGVAHRTTILCESETGAREVKRVSPVIRTLMMTAGDQPPQQLPPELDGWLGNAAVVLRDSMTLDFPYDVELFADLTNPPDERLIIRADYAKSVRALITNDVVAAQKLLAELELQAAGQDH